MKIRIITAINIIGVMITVKIIVYMSPIIFFTVGVRGLKIIAKRNYIIDFIESISKLQRKKLSTL